MLSNLSNLTPPPISLIAETSTPVDQESVADEPGDDNATGASSRAQRSSTGRIRRPR